MITETSTTSFNATNEHESMDSLGNGLKRKKQYTENEAR